MKIIDYAKKGNVIRFYLGNDDCTDYWGDDWNDAPYDCNAGKVYSEYITGYRDVSFSFDCVVLEPCEDWQRNVHWTKEDMKKRKVPCIVAISLTKDDNDWEFEDHFSVVAVNEKSTKYYFGDKMEPQVRGHYDEKKYEWIADE